MSEAYTGGCACGAIRYEISGEPIVHERLPVPRLSAQERHRARVLPDLPEQGERETQGEAKHWDIVGDSGNVKTRAFCPTCGSPVYLTFAAMPDLFTVHAASLDDPSRYKPQVVTYGVRGYAWDHIDPALPKFDKMPPM